MSVHGFCNNRFLINGNGSRSHAIAVMYDFICLCRSSYIRPVLSAPTISFTWVVLSVDRCDAGADRCLVV